MRLIFSFGLLFSSSLAFAQTAKDYFFPSSDKNLSVYKMVNPHGKTEDERITNVYFKYEGDNVVITTQNNFVNRQYDQVSNVNGVTEQSVKVTDSEILAINEKTTTYNGVETFDKSGEIIFKIPKEKNKKVEWENPGQKGAVIQTHLSEFSSIKINGKRKKAIKVTTILKRKRSGKKENFYVDYYVAGIGRYKRTAPNSNSAIEILADQRSDSNIPVVK
jgi:hypothetical protein